MVPPGQISGQICFHVNADTPQVNLRVVATDLYKGDSASSSYRLSVGGTGVSVVPALDGTSSGGSILPWDMPIVMNSMNGLQSKTGQSSSSTSASLQEDVAVTIEWAAGDPELPVGCYCGYVKLIAAAGGQSTEAIVHVCVEVRLNVGLWPPLPNIVVSPLQPVVFVGRLQPGRIPGQVTFRVDSNYEEISVQVSCTHLYRDGSPASGQVISVAGPGAMVYPENGNEIYGGFDDLLEWQAAYTAPDGAMGNTTAAGIFESGQNGMFGQNVTVDIAWNMADEELASGEYSGYVRLVGTTGFGGSSESSVRVHGFVPDTTPPVITGVSASPNTLWPPNNKMVSVAVTVTAVDDWDPSPVSAIVGVTCNEAISNPNSSDNPDWEYTENPLVVLLRAARDGSGSGRVYTIRICCMDHSGNKAWRTVDVTVPHDQGKNKK